MTTQYIDSLLKPLETFQHEKNNGSLLKAIGAIFLSLIIYSILTIGTTAISSNFYGAYSGAIFGIGLTIFMLIIGAIALVISFLISKAMGGKGSFISFFYLVSLFYPLIIILQIIPWISTLASLYSIYLFYLAVKFTHEFTTGKAIVASLGAVIVSAIICVGIIAYFVLTTGLLGGLGIGRFG